MLFECQQWQCTACKQQEKTKGKGQQTRTYLQPHYGKGVFGNVNLLALDSTKMWKLPVSHWHNGSCRSLGASYLAEKEPNWLLKSQMKFKRLGEASFRASQCNFINAKAVMQHWLLTKAVEGLGTN